MKNCTLMKHCKNCESCPSQVTWKVKFKSACLVCSLWLVFPVCPGCPVCPGDHVDQDDQLTIVTLTSIMFVSTMMAILTITMIALVTMMKNLDHDDNFEHDDNFDHDDQLDHDDHLNHDEYHICKELGGCTQTSWRFLTRCARISPRPLWMMNHEKWCTAPVFFLNIAKGTTDPRIEFCLPK